MIIKDNNLKSEDNNLKSEDNNLKSEDNEIKECSICYNTIIKTNNCTIPCGHSFCFTCIVQVIIRNNYSCPNCRKEFVEIENTENSENIDSNDEELTNSDEDNQEFILVETNINNTNDSDTTLSVSEYSSISDMSDNLLEEIYEERANLEIYNNNTTYIDNMFFDINFEKLINLEINEKIDKIKIITEILLNIGYNENEIQYIIYKNFNYKIILDDNNFVEEIILTDNKINLLQKDFNIIFNNLYPNYFV
jgi:hypothetical protein